MPYIKQKVRKELETRLPQTRAEKNYTVFKWLKHQFLENKSYDTIDYLQEVVSFKIILLKMRGMSDGSDANVPDNPFYWKFEELCNRNNIDKFSTLELCWAEFQRRYIDLFEDEKISNPENGDI